MTVMLALLLSARMYQALRSMSGRYDSPPWRKDPILSLQEASASPGFGTPTPTCFLASIHTPGPAFEIAAPVIASVSLNRTSTSWPATILSVSPSCLPARAANSTLMPLLVILLGASLGASSAAARPDGPSGRSTAIATDTTVPTRAHLESRRTMVMLVP